MNNIVNDIMDEGIGNAGKSGLISGPFLDPHNIRKVIARMCCEEPQIPEFQAAETFKYDDWGKVLFPADDNPISNDNELCQQVNKGLEAEGLPRTDRGVVQLIAIWLYS